jgi:tRNA(Ile2)-agmatinylcytidine synthase
MLVGLDDTDSLKGGCTAYLAALLVEELGTTGYPKLIRLNPNIPYKTRGNGAVSFEVDGNPEKVRETVLNLVEKHAHLKEDGTNPGVVFIDRLNPRQRKTLYGFYRKVLSELVTLEDALKTAEKVNAEVHRFNNGRGVIGALAALGSELPDKTYELIAYRSKKNYGKEKKIDRKSVFKMNEETYPETFDNIDPETKKILITPHGYDPVFCGIRGNAAGIVDKAFRLIKPLEEIERTQIFESNQGTDAHMVYRRISELKPYDCAALKGKVSLNPQDIAGGHVLFGFSDGSGEIACAAYEPTGKFRDFIRELNRGDEVKVCGGIGKHPKTLNLEKIRVLKLEKIREKTPPVCCGRKMTSAGKAKGFKCRKCGRRHEENAAVFREIPRNLKPGFYEVPPRARRHLSMPLIRMKSKNN